MSYAECQTAVNTLLLALTDYFPSSLDPKAVGIGVYDLIDRGYEYIAVIVPGRFEVDQAIARHNKKHWNVLVDIFKRYGEDSGANWTKMTDFRDAVIGQLEKYPTLNGTPRVINVVVAADDDPDAVLRTSTPEVGPVYLVQRLRVDVEQIITLTGGEYT